MRERYIAFDVETPNSANHRMSAIGIAVVEGGTIAEEYYTLVDPETHFDPFHVALTGISPELVAGKPNFPAVWEEIRPILDSGLLVAHNAPFDMSVLSQCLRHYGIPWHTTVAYACTCQMSRRLMPGLPNHRLNTLCGHLGLQLDHHHAGSDSRACGEILLRCLESGGQTAHFVRLYDMEQGRTLPPPRSGGPRRRPR